jgi:hypothetical protein
MGGRSAKGGVVQHGLVWNVSRRRRLWIAAVLHAADGAGLGGAG